jgi:eukaryotic-like serine/threonine-protein kinase
VIDSADDVTLAGTFNGESAPYSSPVEPGAVVGRYVVLQRIGVGGMGVVFAAYDPELDRKVALKLLLPGTGGDTGRVRLLREAHALAKLSHPHVVGIHDVGTFGEQVWLAMEFVQGQTLDRWLKTPRGWREVLDVLRRAGEGLAAAHAVGLLHRDFKPDNIMVGDDGRVRVMDFGLARADANAVALVSEPAQPDAEPRAALASNVTRAGGVVGTLHFMAPEQFGHKELTAAADQFAFCVTLWEALYGERPFGGHTPMEVAASVIEGRVRSPTKRRAVPGWLRRACERGLAVEPSQRWPSIGVLLETLAKGRTRAWVRKGLVAVGVLALLGAGVEGQRRWGIARRTAACEATGDEVEAVWNDEREQALRDGLVATGVSHAATTVDKVTPWLERQARQWGEARVEACLDADVRGRWDAETLDRSLWCLDERRTELESLVDELTSADAKVLHKAVTAAAGLAAVATCRDEKVLAARSPPPPEVLEELRTVRADVIRADNLKRAGRYDKGLSLARVALARAEALEWMPLVAAARLQLGALLEASGAYPEAELELEQAYFDAAKGVAPEVAFEAAAMLLSLVGVSAARHAEGRRWARLADVALEEAPDGEHLRRASLLDGLATLHRKTGNHDEAKRLYEQALAIGQAALGSEHPLVATRVSDLATVHFSTGDYDKAKRLYEQAHAIQEETLGPEHPHVATTLNNLANVHHNTGNYDEAKRLYERAYAIQEKALGPAHPHIAHSLNNLANVHLVAGEYDEAKQLYARALAIWDEALGPEHPNVAMTLNNLANVHMNAGMRDEAKRLYTRALAITVKTLGPEHPEVAGGLSNLANVHEATGAHDEAKPLYEQAIASLEKALGPEHPDVAYPLVGLANIALAQRRPSDAIALAQRATTLREQRGVAAEFLAEARFALAKALWDAPTDAGRDEVRAVSLAEQARDAFQAAGTSRAAHLTTVEQWLAEHPREP